MNDRFIGSKELRKIVGNKSRVTIWRWVRSGFLPKPRKIGPNSIAWLESEINEWIEKHRATA